MLTRTRMFFASAVLLAVPLGASAPAVAQPDGPDTAFRLYVPVRLSGLLPEVTHVGVSCQIGELRQWTRMALPADVQRFDGTIFLTVPIEATDDIRKAMEAGFYRCHLLLWGSTGPDLARRPGTPGSRSLYLGPTPPWAQGAPGAYQIWEVSGSVWEGE